MSEPTYCVIDVETTRKGRVEGMEGSPFDPANSIVLRGQKRGDSDPAAFPVSSVTGVLGISGAAKDELRLLVGHNIGFDLHYMRSRNQIDEGFLGTVNLWDTQLAEYLLSGQTCTYASLDELAEKYGGTPKNESVTKFFKDGFGADAVPMEDLEPYLKADLLNTELVFIEQFKRAQQLDMLPLIRTQMDALAATIEMTYNGLKMDVPVLLAGVERVRRRVDTLHEEFQRLIHFIEVPPGLNPTSPKQLSLLLFGGTVDEKVREQVGTYKNGKPKYVTVTKTKPYRGLGLGSPNPLNGSGYYPTDDKVLKRLQGTTTPGTTQRKIIDNVLELREQSKQLGTYWEGMLKLVMPDGCIHHRLNHCVTRTGRLSSSDPNLQNVTNGDIKQAFVSRWGVDGAIVEADFKQLEMVELACLSKDPQLIADIRDGVDMHDALFLSMRGRPMKKEERKAFKRCSFALVYGAGAHGIAEQGEISVGDARHFIETFYTRYRGVKEYHDSIIKWAAATRQYTGLKDKDTGQPVGETVFTAPGTNRRYWFREYPTQWGSINFSPTELKNYMVQGGATGDKVPLCIGKLYRVLRNHPVLKDECLMVNTVHDSVMFDCHRDVLQQALTVIKQVMEETPYYYEQEFGMKMPLPLKVELSYGPNWLEQKEVHYENCEWRLAA